MKQGKVDCWLRGAASLGLMGALVHSGLMAQASSSAVPGRLTVRPSEMAMGTKNAAAGAHEVDALKGYLVYVPPACVGEQRCPLVVVLHGGGGSGQEQLDRQREFADRDGMILLLGSSVVPGRWDIMGHFVSRQLTMDSTVQNLIRAMPDDPDVRNLDAAMKHVLGNYAIDPAKIGALGMSDGGSYTLFLGRNNLDIFSRLVAMSPGVPFSGAGPKNPATQMFVLGGIAEPPFLQGALTASNELRKDGHRITQAMLLRGHEQRQQDYDLAFKWLKDSWAPAGAAALPAPRTVGVDALTLLTPEILEKMTTFWTGLMKQPDSILGAGRHTLRTEVVVPVGEMQLLVPMFDIPAMAAQFPSVAAGLQAAGLTAQEEENYAAAIFSAAGTRQAKATAGTVPAGSPLASNLEFVAGNLEKLNVLFKTGFWTAQ